MIRSIASVLFLLQTGFAQTENFEVASVRQNTTNARPSVGRMPGGERFMARNMPLPWLLSMAYEVSIRQIAVPAPFSAQNYDVEAKMNRAASSRQMMAMLRSLLEERFRLSVRRETKEIAVHVLVVAKGGPKLNENHDGAELAIQKIDGSKTRYHNMTMPLFASILAGAVDDVVTDKTNLDGSYDFTLSYTPERVGPGVLEGREPAPDPNGPSLFTALQEQLGLKLESRREPTPFLVVEHIEKLAQN